MVRGPRPFNARDDDGSGEFPFQPAVVVTVSGGNLKLVFGITGVDPVVQFERVLQISGAVEEKGHVETNHVDFACIAIARIRT